MYLNNGELTCMKDVSKYHTFAICAYGESPFLEECILSLLAQSVKSDIIMCAPESTPFLTRISEKYKIPLYIRYSTADIRDDWNFAYDNSKTKYVTLAHQDDLYHAKFTEETLKTMLKYKKPLFCVTDYLPIKLVALPQRDINCRIRHFLRSPLKIKFLSDKPLIKRAILAFGNSLCCPTVTYNKALLGDTIFKSQLHYDIDWDTFYLLGQRDGSIAYVDKTLAYYRIHNGATSKEFITNHKRMRDDEIMFSKFWPKPIVDFLMRMYKEAYKNYDE